MLILGIESSCDETAAAVIEDGNRILSSVISSQIELHKPFGGVVPELASREHLEKIEPIVKEALEKAQVSFKDIDAVAVTQGPGLVGSLLVGVCYAKALAFALDIPFIGVNHIEGHLFSVVFENPPVEYPALALIVSGGHTNLFFVPEAGKYKVVSRTRDDAAGEAFDKVAKMLGLDYPGGPEIEKLARTGDGGKVKFPIAKISDGRPDFSFSGLKTSIMYFVRDHVKSDPDFLANNMNDICASVQKRIVTILLNKLKKAAAQYGIKTLAIAGGVSANSGLRNALMSTAEDLNWDVFIPEFQYCTDNAAMIAIAGYYKYLRKDFAGQDIAPLARMEF